MLSSVLQSAEHSRGQNDRNSIQQYTVHFTSQIIDAQPTETSQLFANDALISEHIRESKILSTRCVSSNSADATGQLLHVKPIN